VINLLDTPGHQDFSKDTCADRRRCRLMAIDANGVEPQARRPLQVCWRGTPILTFVNKMDRMQDPMSVMDEIDANSVWRSCLHLAGRHGQAVPRRL
jgi:peptide subunit release factor RF-3